MRPTSFPRPSSAALARVLALTAIATLSHASLAYPDDDKSYRAGIGFLNKGLNDLAAAELRSYLKDNPQGSLAASAHYSLAVCLVRLARHADAIAQLEPVLALKDFEFAPDALLLRAQCAAATADDSGAVASLTRLTKEFPKFAQLDHATQMLGESLYRQGKPGESLATLSLALEKWPASPLAPRAGLFAAMSEMALKEFDAAAARSASLRAASPSGEYAANLALIEAQCRTQLGNLPAAVTLYTLAAESPQAEVRTEALLGLASAARAQGDFARAQQALEGAAKPAPTGMLRDRLTLERGKLLFDQDKPTEALKLFAQSQTFTSEALAAQGIYWAAKCQIKLGKLDEAADLLSRAAAKFATSPLVPDMLFDRAAALSKAGKEEASLEAWDQWQSRFAGSDLAPDALIAQALTAQAWCAHRLGKFDQSLTLCRTLASKFPKRAGEESTLLLIAENEFGVERFEPALKAYSEFSSRHPQSKHAWRSSIKTALCLAKLGRDGEAQAALETALKSKDEQDPALRRLAMTTLADGAFARRDWASAEQLFARLIAETSAPESSLDALLRQGICLERQGRFAAALPVFERVLKEGPATPQALHARFESGQSLAELGKLDEARAAMEEVIATEKGTPLLTPHAQRHLATIASRQGRHEDAARILTTLSQSKLAGTAGASGDALLELGSAWLSASKYEEAERVLGQFIASHANSKRLPEAHARIAIAINRQGRPEESLKHLDAIDNLTSLDAQARTAAMYERSLALRSLGRDQDAAKACQALLLEPASSFEAFAALDLAQFESKADHHDEAMKLLSRCLTAASRLDIATAAPVLERATYMRAACLLRLSKPSEAAEALKSFAASYPKSTMLASAQLLRGEALLSSGQAKAAADEFTRAIASATSDEIRSPATLRLGEALAACQDWPASEKAFTSFLDASPKSELWFQAAFGQGWARENQGRHDAAITAYKDIVSRHKGPTAARAQFQIGECLFAQKKFEEAAAELLKTDVLFEYPEWSAAALYEAGRCFAEMGRSQDSTKQFDDLLKRFPKTRWAEMAKERQTAKAAAKTPAPIPGRATTVAPGSR